MSWPEASGASVATTAMQLPAGLGCSSSGRGRTRPTGTPSTRRSGAEPKFASTSTPTVPSSGTTRLAVPIPPFQSKHVIPVPAPTAPSATAPPRAAASARPASAASTCTTALSDSQLSSHSATSGITTSVVPTAGSAATAAVTAPSKMRPTAIVDVR